MEISGRTKVCALIGDPVEHSLSPAMHNAAFKHLDLDYVYLAFKVRREELRDAVNGVKALKIHGLNVTKPLKVEITTLLDRLDESALNIGAVNTVLRVGDKLIGYNTDCIGALEALREAGVNLEGMKAVILGAGGAARAVAFATAPKVKELVILNRTITKAESLSRDLKHRLGVDVRFGGLSEVEKEEELKDIEEALRSVRRGIEAVIVGALESNYQKERIERICENLGLKMIAPLWHMDRDKIWKNLLDSGFRVMITKVAAGGLDRSWLGRVIDEDNINDFLRICSERGIHPGGEGGEFETTVLDCPIYKKKLEVLEGREVWEGDSGVYLIKNAILIEKKGE